MLSWFFRCISCRGGIQLRSDYTHFPLCEPCHESLFPCPKLCKSCGSPICLTYSDEKCSRPWIAQGRGLEIHSYSALYHMVDPCYRVLKSWKKSRGPLFDRRILKSNHELLTTWKEFQPDAIVPIPQNFSRAWKMGGSRTECLADWVSTQTQVPVHFVLKSKTSLKRQAELNLEGRLQSTSRFYMNDSWHSWNPWSLWTPWTPWSKNFQNVLLVDDFMTSGRTLFQAASLLRQFGVLRVHAFCLGIRARRC